MPTTPHSSSPPPTDDVVVDVATLSHFLGITETRIQQLSKIELTDSQGYFDCHVIQRESHGKYLKNASTQGYIRYLQDCIQKRVGEDAAFDDCDEDGNPVSNNDTPTVLLTLQKIRTETAKADMAELDVLERKATLVPASKVMESWMKMLYAARQKFLYLPSKAAKDCFACESVEEIKSVLKGYVWKALEELAQSLVVDELPPPDDFEEVPLDVRKT